MKNWLPLSKKHQQEIEELEKKERLAAYRLASRVMQYYPGNTQEEVAAYIMRIEKDKVGYFKNIFLREG